MDEASSLVAELQRKLSELDHKVWLYRRDMTTEYEKFSETLLRNVSHDVSETVSRTMKELMKGYQSLYPDGIGAIDSRPTGSSAVNNGSSSALPIPTPNRRIDDSIHKEDSPRSPHEREKEFRGVFTPSYLPLLDSSSHRRASVDISAYAYDNKSKRMETADASTEVGKSLVSSPEATRPSTPRRRNTDEASTSSDVSDSTPRRSALRRSSSGSKGGQSPRRVRFDVQGEEVLPTSSPLPSSTIAEEDLGAPAFPSDDEAESEQIENISSSTAPKRISSTQKLRLLSRSPLDDDTVWTAVSAPPDGSASVAISNPFSLTEDDEEGKLSLVTDSKSAATPEPLNIIKTPKSPPPKISADSENEMDTQPLRDQSSSSASMLSPAIPNDISSNKSPTASTRSAGVDLLTSTKDAEESDLQDFDAEEMFHFDEAPPSAGAYGSPLHTQNSASEVTDSDSEDEGLSISPSRTRTKTLDRPNAESQPISLSSYSRSPARGIIQPENKENKENKGTGKTYKNHPFTVPIVKPEVHANAEKMGEVESFVGSVDGRTGVDESDPRSWKGQIGSASLRGLMGNGTSRYGSLGERMMMEEMMEARKEEQKTKESGRKK